jgi:hypothetical protein
MASLRRAQPSVANLPYDYWRNDMTCTRRRFIRTVAVTLASLVASNALTACASSSSTPTHEEQKTSAWERLRQSWLELSALKDISLGADWDATQAALEQHSAAHQAALDELVADGQISQAVSEQLQLVFTEAVHHVQRSMATCYIALPFEYNVRVDLLQQTHELHKLAGELDLDQAVVAQAQTAIARDVAFFEAVQAGQVERTQIEQQFQSEQLQASPAALEAASLLVDLLLNDVQ